MKLITVYSGSSKIEVLNSIWGTETIKVNDKIVSSKFSVFGAKHVFTQIENNEEIVYEVQVRFGFGITVDIFRQGIPLVEFPKFSALRFFFFVFMVALIFKLL